MQHCSTYASVVIIGFAFIYSSPSNYDYSKRQCVPSVCWTNKKLSGFKLVPKFQVCLLLLKDKSYFSFAQTRQKVFFAITCVHKQRTKLMNKTVELSYWAIKRISSASYEYMIFNLSARCGWSLPNLTCIEFDSKFILFTQRRVHLVLGNVLFAGIALNDVCLSIFNSLCRSLECGQNWSKAMRSPKYHHHNELICWSFIICLYLKAPPSSQIWMS